MIKSQIDSTKASMEIAMDDAGLKWSDISKILLVGGSTRIPAIQNMIKDLTGIEPSHELNPDEAVAMGAAYYADTLNVETTGEKPKAEKEIKVTDVNSHSLGVITVDDNNENEYATFLIKRNTPIPAYGEDVFKTVVENQKSLRVRVVEGEDEDPEYDTIIGTSLMDLTPRPKGSPLRFMMQYDSNGIIHVRVKDDIDGRDLGEMHIDREANLTDEEVNDKKKYIGGIDIE
jgi:molecular chaperone DnaK